MEQPLVKAVGLYRHFGEFCAVRDLAFNLNRGEILGLLGPNGAGKSTTLRMLSGALAPSAGDIWLNGVNLREHPRQAKKTLGYLPEPPPLVSGTDGRRVPRILCGAQGAGPTQTPDGTAKGQRPLRPR